MFKVCVVLAGLLVASACAEEQAPAPVIVGVEIRGSVRLPPTTALSLLHTEAGQVFDEQKWNGDWQRLTDSGLFQSVRVTPPIQQAKGITLVVDLIERPAIEELTVEGVTAEKAVKVRNACAGLIGSLDTPTVRKCFSALAREVLPQATGIDLTEVVLRSRKPQIAGAKKDIPEAIRLVIKVK